ncbi:VCBS repeat-containing protein [Fodinibius salsisoli]|uniref:VCBS repeat-containing protein n=1 Tax=Fodinibius salsisoli TaxID=2820877 RepID=A0ABT3PKN6_9BACT|nr:VCBS repeat-containing protein [Fodinibius salsisoli]MCW9706503.1 VCBS repeat-containing protein [Fodinibius salsisoli]
MNKTWFSNYYRCVHSGWPLIVLLFLVGCSGDESTPLFETVPADQTKIHFSNDLQPTPDFNMLNYLYFYDGGGVSIGDINNDGLSDIYFTGNMKPNKLYINQGNFEFRDITGQAGVAGAGDWTSGTTMADVNGDGLLDIYVCNINYLSQQGRNELFINNGDGTFTEKAKQYGLDFQGYAKQAAFFDYDNDGDLDVYLLNHAVHSNRSYGDVDQRKINDPRAGDRLYRNEGERFTNVTAEAGIYNSITGYGLAVATSDLNNDGCTDIYISNDFHENDYLYRNNCDGTFTEVLEKSMGHTSRASMGNDAADFNNDGWIDLFVADMLPHTEKGRKTAISSETYKVYTIQRQFGYHPQLVQNTLQINRGTDSTGQLTFSEIAQYAGVNATDWSWATLFLDMNNDGFKDLYVTNGIYRRPNNLDYLLYIRRDSTQQGLGRQSTASDLSALQKMPHTKVPNAGFINNGDYTFSYKSDDLGMGSPTYSNGAAYGDLDNDGDLDLVTNNVNGKATIQRNLTREGDEGNYIQISLQGDSLNTHAIGSKIMIYDSSTVQKYELFTTRGFLSSVEPRITAGVGQSKNIDSLQVMWPDGSKQIRYNITANQHLNIDQGEGGVISKGSSDKAMRKIFKDITQQVGLDYVHREDSYIDFNRQPLTPFMLSTQGPALASGDVNNDGLDDFFIGGAKRQPGEIFLQQNGGQFRSMKFSGFESDAMFEDVGATFFDANGDGWLDLYVVSGGNEFSYQSEGLQDRLYMNDGAGRLVRVDDALPGVYENGSVVAPADYDGDGDVDLFVGSRSVPQNYGLSPDSHLLENQGNGMFKEVTDQVAPALRKLGMVTDAAWNDMDGNGKPDLIISGEWMPITIFYNEGEKLQPVDAGNLAQTEGWWQSIATGDFDGDGDSDIMAGNMGTNGFLKASREEPIVMYLKDFNEDGQTDPIVGYTREGKEYPVAPRDELLTPFKFLRPKFSSYEDYAGQTIQQILGSTLNEGSLQKKKVTMLQSVFIETLKDGTFAIHPLPVKAQWAPIFTFLSDDINSDGRPDLLTAGNFHDVKPSLGGRYDAGYGLYLKGKKGGFESVNILDSGFKIEGQTKAIHALKTGAGMGKDQMIIVARNNLPVLFFTISE